MQYAKVLSTIQLLGKVTVPTGGCKDWYFCPWWLSAVGGMSKPQRTILGIDLVVTSS